LLSLVLDGDVLVYADNVYKPAVWGRTSIVGHQRSSWDWPRWPRGIVWKVRGASRPHFLDKLLGNLSLSFSLLCYCGVINYGLGILDKCSVCTH